MTFFVAVFLFGIGVWIMTAAGGLFLDDVKAANELPKEEYKSKLRHAFGLFMVGSFCICLALVFLITYIIENMAVG